MIFSFLEMLKKLTPHQSLDKVTETLYTLASRSMPALFLFTLFLTYFLYDALGYRIVAWGGVMLVLIGGRIVASMLFRYRRRSMDTKRWYRIFAALSMATAVLMAVVGGYFFYDVSEFQKLFIITALVGLTSGAQASLYPDIRLLFGYIGTILLPLLIAVFSVGTPLFGAIGLMTILYFATLVFVGLNALKYERTLSTKEQEIQRTKEALFNEREALHYFYRQAPVPIFSYDLNLVITDCNEAMVRLFQTDRDDLVGLDLRTLPDSHPYEVTKKALEEGIETYIGPYRSRKGKVLWVEARAFALHTLHGEVIGGVVMIEDKTNEHEAQARLHYLAKHDVLTELYNRSAFEDYIADIVADSRHQTFYSLVYYFDLDRFKSINDTLGHHFGDHLLQEVAGRLKRTAQEAIVIARIGGDEFVALEPFVASDETNARQRGEHTMQRFLELFESPFIVEGIRLDVHTSIGATVVCPQEPTIKDAVRRADIAMYHAKRSFSKRVRWFDEDLARLQEEQAVLRSDLEKAIKEDGLRLYLQPIVALSDQRVQAAEALVRWEHPSRGLLMPATFVPLAKEMGMIDAIGWWMIECVCRTLQRWKRDGYKTPEYISINLDAKGMLKSGFFEKLESIVSRYEVAPSELVFEIAEADLVDNYTLLAEVIDRLKVRGYGCAVDDYGIGYSSLTYLRIVAFAWLKIDRRFTESIDRDDKQRLILETVIAAAERFGYRIVVEGVEKESQLAVLHNLKRDTLCYQGYLVSPAVSSDRFERSFLVGD